MQCSEAAEFSLRTVSEPQAKACEAVCKRSKAGNSHAVLDSASCCYVLGEDTVMERS